MREHVMADGVQMPVEDLDRGQVLLRSHGEWARTYDEYTKGRARFDVVVLAALTVLVFGLVLTPFAIVGIVLAGIILLAGLAIRHSYLSTRIDLLRGGAVPGVYVHGVQLPMYPVYTSRLFIPYSEMVDAWVRSSRMGDDVLFMAVRGSRWRWRYPGGLLGQDGVAAVLERARDEPGPAVPDLPERTPPKLVVYTAGGATPPRPPGGP